ncbi:MULTISPECIES: hypothetical protein [Sulfolobaceae]|uniref:Uncharacterized protein n=3 Tax=Sulfurisphaera TaxID=69655 RepID=F9VP71_SULTO|nr:MULTISPECIES: hypothetical protein [Sulfolobaceae]MBB5253354.1 formamidopyrimidine-DNA glycosylase [Sulfurisphaera ohwakuensis]QGR17676.1 hypothetical protein D1869_11185 [Sulfurisphaera ohwakuensis]QIW24837.1 hypothetical protein EWF20_12345 [Sulfolobus sp. S-194]BAK54718.1 hypothetical protein STK_20395 [Sulfurisphaera tokodaii str. 7]HII72869.1 hypothetical protein [Sulfurisphaera tokodaii]
MRASEEIKKYYAITELDLDVPQIASKMHEHISSAIDEALDRVREYLKTHGYEGKFQANVNVFVKEEGETPRLIQTVKTKIIVK